MDAPHYITCLWPGLPEVWWRGRLAALPTALAFGLFLNLYLVARFLYPHWVSPALVGIAFWVGTSTWVFLVIRSLRDLPELIDPRSVSDEPDRFPEAHLAYLQGNWVEAEGKLTALLSIEPRDPPALLLLTGVYRHTDRLESAEMLLDEISRLEVADGWWLELAAERQRLIRAKQQSPPEEGQELDPDAADLTERPLAA